MYGDAEGWSGDIDKILIFHFVDGTGAVDEQRAVFGKYVNAYAQFYNNSRLDLENSEVPLYEQDLEIRDFLLKSRKDKPSKELKPCLLYISNAEP